MTTQLNAPKLAVLCATLSYDLHSALSYHHQLYSNATTFHFITDNYVFPENLTRTLDNFGVHDPVWTSAPFIEDLRPGSTRHELAIICSHEGAC